MLPLALEGGMYIAVQCNLHGGMAQDFTQALDIKSDLHTSSGKGVSERVKWVGRQAAFFEIAFEAVLQGAGFYTPAWVASEQIGIL